jgi:glucuronide carrier protein
LKFTITCALLGVLAVILYLICFANTREVVPRSTAKTSIRSTLKMVRGNKPLIVLCAGAFFLLAAMFTMNAVAMYYARYVLGNSAWFTFLALAQTVGTIIVASLAPAITVKLGKKNGYTVSALVAIAGFVLIYFVPAGSLPTAIVAWFLFGVGTGGTNALMFSMQADTVDYGEWASGTRSEGGSYSILSFIRKTGQGVGGWMGAAVIGAFGYVAQAPEQSAQALQGIRLATGLVPAVLAVLAVVVMWRYPLTMDQHRKIVDELNERRIQGEISDSLGVDAEAIKVEPVGDGRTTLLRSPERGTLPVITLFELDGAGATEIGPRLAERFGVPFVQQRFSSEQLAKGDADMLLSGNSFSRWLGTVSYTGTTDASMAQGSDVSEDHALAVQNTREVLDAVADGGVILGRNGAFVLSKAVGAFHVRLTAPIGKRIERVVDKAGLSPSEAAEQIETEDRVRAELSRRLYRWDPNADEYYDLVINTGSVTYKQVVEIIENAYLSKYPTAKPETE